VTLLFEMSDRAHSRIACGVLAAVAVCVSLWWVGTVQFVWSLLSQFWYRPVARR